MSRDALGKHFSWSERLRGHQPGDLNAWETVQKELPKIAARLRDVQFFRADALKLLSRFDSPATLFYLDPPYALPSQSARKAYRFPMADEDHARLLAAIVRLRGMVIISGCHGQLYDQALRTWTCLEKDMPNHAAQGKHKQRRTEVLWLNPACGGPVLTDADFASAGTTVRARGHQAHA
jgi:DNA adenine methylase